ncbi:hypothetical protein [Candidatus Poriferisodalis multihospitum]|uniref:hypothetical protein n=1 Tax=Candidatus Poriferisodalis multihospitum TaxID=2983191 RepID=UPI002B25C9D5|nr:hypothetical protein [Candidatus Poriferisodalis multihospitum]
MASVGLSYFAASAGLRYERKVFSDWPYGLPTHQWLLPGSTRLSRQQRNLYYESICQLLDLDLYSELNSGDEQQIAQTIDDAVRSLRSRFRQHPDRGLLTKHNEDYGFVRNFAGMSLLWFSASAFAAGISWYLLLKSLTELAWALVNSAVLVVASVMAYKRRDMVYQRAERYAESFFSRLTEERSRLAQPD